MAGKSFFKRMVEEKGLLEESVTIQHEGFTHIMEVAVLIDLIESTSEEEKEKITKAFSLIDFRNGDLLHYLRFLAAAYLTHNY